MTTTVTFNKHDYTSIEASLSNLQKEVTKFTDQIVTTMKPIYESNAIAWGESLKGYSTGSYVIDEGTKWELTGTWGSNLSTERSPSAVPKQVTGQQILDSLEKIVTAVGSSYVATSHATNKAGPDGRRCVQGELMLDLGWPKNEYLPGGYTGVSDLFCAKGDITVFSFLERAEMMNDLGVPWGEILTMAKTCFGKAA